MRKGLFFLFVIIILALTGCSTTPEPKMHFSSGICVSTEDISFKGNFSRSETKMTLKVTYPKNLQGYTYNISEDRAKITYMGIREEIPLNTLPSSAPIRVLKDAFESIEGKSPTKDKEGYIIKSKGYTVKLNNEGYIESINTKEMDITFVKNYKQL